MLIHFLYALVTYCLSKKKIVQVETHVLYTLPAIETSTFLKNNNKKKHLYPIINKRSFTPTSNAICISSCWSISYTYGFRSSSFRQLIHNQSIYSVIQPWYPSSSSAPTQFTLLVVQSLCDHTSSDARGCTVKHVRPTVTMLLYGRIFNLRVDSLMYE